MSLRITSLVRPAGEGNAPGPDGGEDFHNFRGEFALSTNDPVIRTALRVLDEARPRSLPFETLWARVEERLASSAFVPGPGEHPAASPERLAEALLGAFAHNILELHVREPGFTTEIGEFPRASPVARLQAAERPRVANLRHRMVALMDFDQFVLPLLDGRHDRTAILAELQGAVKDGILKIQYQGRPIAGSTEDGPILERLLEQSLRRLASGALLVG